MESISIHVSGKTAWALCRCKHCGEIQKFTIAQALAGPVECMRCLGEMDIKGAVIEAVDRMRTAPGKAY
jgi:hypothetical protein